MRRKHRLTETQVENALKQHRTQKEAARALNVPPTTLSDFIRKHGFRKVERWERAQ